MSIQAMSMCLSTLTLTLIAVDRYILIVHPTRRPINTQRACALIALVWSVSAMIATPYALHIVVVGLFY
jgi:hypothetical protein